MRPCHPLDTSELAARALNGYTHVMVYSRSLHRPVTAVVGDIYHRIQLYIAGHDDNGEDHAYLITAANPSLAADLLKVISTNNA